MRNVTARVQLVILALAMLIALMVIAPRQAGAISTLPQPLTWNNWTASNQGILLDSMESGNWIGNSPGSIAIVNNSTNGFVEGTGSTELIMNPNNGMPANTIFPTGSVKETFNTPINTVNGEAPANLYFWMYLPNETQFFGCDTTTNADFKCGGVYLDIYDSNSNEYVCPATSGQYADLQNGWNPIDIAISACTLKGNSFSWGSISTLEFDAYLPGKYTKNVTVNFDNLRYDYGGGAFNKAQILLTFDGGWPSMATNASPIMRINHQTGTAFVVTDQVGVLACPNNDWNSTANGGCKDCPSNEVNGQCGDCPGNCVNLSQLQMLYNEGWDLASHTADHVNLVDNLSQEHGNTNGIEFQMAKASSMLKGWGFTNGHMFFAYPNGAYNATVISVIQQQGNYTFSRTADGFGLTQPNIFEDSPYNLSLRVQTITMSPEQSGGVPTNEVIDSYIQNAIAENGLITLTFHVIQGQLTSKANSADLQPELCAVGDNSSDNATSCIEYTTADFLALSNYLRQQECDGNLDVDNLTYYYSVLNGSTSGFTGIPYWCSELFTPPNPGSFVVSASPSSPTNALEGTNVLVTASAHGYYNTSSTYTWTASNCPGIAASGTGNAFNYTVPATAANCQFTFVANDGLVTNSSATAPISAIVPLSVTAQPSSNRIINLDQTLPVNALGIGGGGTYKYTWSAPNCPGFTSNTDQSFTYTPNGITSDCVFTVTISNGTATSSASTNQITVTDPPPLLISAQPSNAVKIIVGQTLPVNAVASGGSGNYIYTWSTIGSCPGAAASGKGPSNTYAPSANTATCQFSFTANDGFASSTADTGVISANIPETLLVSAQPSSHVTINAGQTIEINAVTQGGSGNYIYTWTASNCPDAMSGNGSSIAYSPASNSASCQFDFTANDGTTQNSANTAIISINRAPSITISVNSLVASGNTETIAANVIGGTPSYTYTFFNVTGKSNVANCINTQVPSCSFKAFTTNSNSGKGIVFNVSVTDNSFIPETFNSASITITITNTTVPLSSTSTTTTSTTSTSTTATTTISSGGVGGGGGTGGGGGGGGSDLPTVIDSGSSFTVYNLTQLGTFGNGFCGEIVKVTDNYITPTTTGITVNGQGYYMTLHNASLINGTENCYAELLNISYLPIEQTVVIKFFDNNTVNFTNATLEVGPDSAVQIKLKPNEPLGNIKVSNVTYPIAPPPKGLSETLVFNVTAENSSVKTINLVAYYTCDISNPEPYMLGTGALAGNWIPIVPFYLNTTYCRISFSVPSDPIIALMRQNASSTSNSATSNIIPLNKPIASNSVAGSVQQLQQPALVAKAPQVQRVPAKDVMSAAFIMAATMALIGGSFSIRLKRKRREHRFSEAVKKMNGSAAKAPQS